MEDVRSYTSQSQSPFKIQFNFQLRCTRFAITDLKSFFINTLNLCKMYAKYEMGSPFCRTFLYSCKPVVKTFIIKTYFSQRSLACWAPTCNLTLLHCNKVSFIDVSKQLTGKPCSDFSLRWNDWH